MNNGGLIKELYEIGKLPSERDDAIDTFPLESFDRLLQQLVTPVNEEEAIKLINLSPPVDTGSFGVEWTLLHLAETLDTDKIQNVLDRAEDNEVKRLMQIRLDNYNKKK